MEYHKAQPRGPKVLYNDDTNFLYVSKSLKKIQKYINLDLRFVCNWLKANKISLNASKTEMLVFRDPRRKIDYDLKIKIDGKKVTPSKFVKYLGIYLDNYLSWLLAPDFKLKFWHPYFRI